MRAGEAQWSRPGDAGKATAQPSQSGKSYAVSESGVWAMRAARICASSPCCLESSSAGGRRAQHAPAPPGPLDTKSRWRRPRGQGVRGHAGTRERRPAPSWRAGGLNFALVRPGAESVAWLWTAIAEARGADPLGPVTVVVPFEPHRSGSAPQARPAGMREREVRSHGPRRRAVWRSSARRARPHSDDHCLRGSRYPRGRQARAET